ncbi:MAG: phosphotransferase [Thermodesulfobacteriota bacterium]
MNSPMSAIMRDLKDPNALPDETREVNVVQTHISVVFVADHYVYKIKKPVDFGFLDFSSLQKRAYYCERELELNRRLSHGVYLEVLPVRIEGNRYTLKAGSHDVAEYALRMKRIPEERLMKGVFARGEITRDDLERVARVLACFHLNATRSDEIDQFGRPERFKFNTDENFDQVAPYVGITISQEQYDRVKTWTECFYSTQDGRFLDRIAQGKIRDCHGDLHMEHICLTEDLPIIDCIEFNDRFRYGDTVSDIAFLLMDLEYRGGKDMAANLWKAYKAVSRENDVEHLLTFYKVYRAFVRGKVNSFQLDDPAIGEAQKGSLMETARRYFALACSYIDKH